ncbi:MAG: DNA repair protein RecN [Clostridiales bacterium]|nr:DNA repair protein RecN [Clostridiales bacterium]
MLLELQVRNLALIEQADMEFGEGLNILTGETGAGKSILIGSVNLALGQKAQKDMIRSGAEYAYVELIFSVEEEKLAALAALDVRPDEDGLLIISRKLMPTRSVSRINDETVTVARLRTVTGLLIDIHGQHEHQSLLHASKHLEILDTYVKNQTEALKKETAELFGRYQTLKARLAESDTDQESRRREADFLRFEIEEIEGAGLKDGEEEELTRQYRKLANGRRILECLSETSEAVDSDGVGRALRCVSEVVEYDDNLKPIRDQLYDAEALLNDIHHAVRLYLDQVEFDEEELAWIELRLDVIHGLQAKYGNSVVRIHQALAERKARLDELEHFDEYRKRTEQEFQAVTERLETVCQKLSGERKTAAKALTERIRIALRDLNFLDVRFSMEFGRLPHYTAAGFDEAEFRISTNPGEPERSLGMVASGGELSRIMLAIKTVLADSDEIPTLIFDEIDTGISGRTAQKVSEQLAILSRSHQVLCITHLPQIASMADCHFEIAKSVSSGKTKTGIQQLSEDEIVAELARLLGGAEITDTVMKNAGEMRRLAAVAKAQARKKAAADAPFGESNR